LKEDAYVHCPNLKEPQKSAIVDESLRSI